VIGLTLGLSCSALIVLSLLTAGVLNIDEGDNAAAFASTNTPFVVTATNDPANPVPPTQTPFIVTATESETGDSSQSVVIAASATPITSPTPAVQATQETAPTTQTDTVGALGSSATDLPLNTPLTTGNEIPTLLQGIISDTATVQGGTFQMGTSPQEVALAVRECTDRDGASCTAVMGEDSYPAHAVTLDTFNIETTEVTIQQYVAFLNTLGPSSHRNGCFNQKCIDTTSENDANQIIFDGLNYDVSAPIFNDFPAVSVTWFGARAYCEAIGRRLPTEAEWERAARGINNFIYPWGDTWDVTLARTNRPDPTDVGARPVGSYPAGLSGFGALDMAGNVGERVFDYYQANYYSQPAAIGLNPTGPPSGTDRVIRGGSWDTPPFFARTVHRQNQRPDETFLWLGFRCAEEFDPNPNVQNSPANPSTLGSLTGQTPIAEPTREQIDAAPTLPPPPTSAAPATEIPAVPPGG
jgi:formylglycine-generating enzyme required for sulfatase activity